MANDRDFALLSMETRGRVKVLMFVPSIQWEGPHRFLVLAATHDVTPRKSEGIIAEFLANSFVMIT